MFLESCFFYACAKCDTVSKASGCSHSPTRWKNGQSIFSRHFSCFLFGFFMERKTAEFKKSFSSMLLLYLCKFSVITRKSQLTLNLHVSIFRRRLTPSWRAQRARFFEGECHLSAVRRITVERFSAHILSLKLKENLLIFVLLKRASHRKFSRVYTMFSFSYYECGVDEISKITWNHLLSNPHSMSDECVYRIF